ncbi:MAG: diaminopimelate decarboxylase [Vicinamibacterales bacterium]
MTGFSTINGRLSADAVPLPAIAEAAGTPAYVYSASLVRERYRSFDRAFAGHPHAVHVALKANSTLAIVRLLHELGADMDANSIGEIAVARRAGVQPSEIVFTGVGKTDAELSHAIALGIKAINAESPGELERVADIARAQRTTARVALRVNPDVDAKSHPHISTGLKQNKFGVPLETVPALCRWAAVQPTLRLVGLHVHIGSQLLDVTPLARVAETLASLARTLADDGIALEYLDVGGGLGVAYEGGDAPTFERYAETLLQILAPVGLPLVLEPGRVILAPTGVLLTRVVDVKSQGGDREVVVVDAAMTDLLRPALYGAFHRIEPVIETADRPPKSVDIVGPVCETSDSFGIGRTLPAPRVGDLLAIRDVGAYGIVMASNYNRRLMPPEILVDGDGWQIVRRRQTIDDLIGLEA